MKQIHIFILVASALSTLSSHAMDRTERILSQVVNESPTSQHMLLIPYKDPLYDLPFASACETKVKGRMIYVPAGETLTLETPLVIRHKEEDNDLDICLALGSEVFQLTQDHLKRGVLNVLLHISKDSKIALVARDKAPCESPLDRSKSLDRE